MQKARLALGIAGLILVIFSAWQLQSPAQGLREIRSVSDGMPVIFLGPDGAMNGSRPLVLVGHGLAGSDRIMRGFAYTFARAGYVSALWDFRGHGANPNPMTVGYQDTSLIEIRKPAIRSRESRVSFGGSSGRG